jgi:hypothetical protein
MCARGAGRGEGNLMENIKQSIQVMQRVQTLLFKENAIQIQGLCHAHARYRHFAYHTSNDDGNFPSYVI